ncbi:MmcQ/YjbR family DNA-binding protein [Sulfurimonas sp. MAG313]|nr:MmcQ/YjbR family DNA-binding protein [Sulfurimonas sp. MAG313]MDF1880243.1 MmcQ/YjbR family DNA-binding protein [Sulfurimonas sp. MAG313]
MIDLEKYCLAKKGAVKVYPFDKFVAVYKVGNKIFALSKDSENPRRINLKCNPIYALELRSLYKSVISGYHMNKKHWNTVCFEGDVDEESILTWIDDSYKLVFSSLTKKEQIEILAL